MRDSLARKIVPGVAASSDAAAEAARYAEFLPAAQALIEKEHSPLARMLALTISAAFLALVAWAGLSEVEQVASAPAQVRPAGRVKLINHPDGGRVTAIHVREGEMVKAGQVLLELDPDVLREDVSRLSKERAELAGQVARLEAEALEDAPLFPDDVHREWPQVVEANLRQLHARREALAQRREAAERVVEQRETEVDALRKDIAAQKKSLAIMQEQETAVGSLAGEGYFPKLQYLTIQRQRNDLEAKVVQATEQLRVATAALSEARNRLTSVTSENYAQVLAELAEAKTNLIRAESSLAQQESRRINLVVKAPDDGIVQSLAIFAVGQAIAPNEPMMRVVPVEERLIVEARVSNADIGYVRVGQPATVKVQTYDFVKFGTLSGKVEQIAADATVEQQGQPPTFVVQVLTDRNYLGDTPGAYPVYPGMLADVDMLIDRRSILSYLTDRVLRTSEGAFRER